MSPFLLPPASLALAGAPWCPAAYVTSALSFPMIQTFSDICWHPLPWPLSCVMIAHTPVSGFLQPLLSRARWACDPRGPAQPGRLTWLPSPDLPPDLPKNFLSGTVCMSPGASHPPGGPGLVSRLLLRHHPGSGGEPPGSCVRKWHLPSGTFTTACLEEVWSPLGTSSQPPSLLLPSPDFQLDASMKPALFLSGI